MVRSHQSFTHVTGVVQQPVAPFIRSLSDTKPVGDGEAARVPDRAAGLQDPSLPDLPRHSSGVGADLGDVGEGNVEGGLETNGGVGWVGREKGAREAEGEVGGLLGDGVGTLVGGGYEGGEIEAATTGASEDGDYVVTVAGDNEVSIGVTGLLGIGDKGECGDADEEEYQIHYWME